jgi:hypothetical protein
LIGRLALDQFESTNTKEANHGLDVVMFIMPKKIEMFDEDS